jgi:hypothetical protein
VAHLNCAGARYISRRNTGSTLMRAEISQYAEQIETTLELLRRRL